MTLPLTYLLDTPVISELRKQDQADPGVQRFFQHAFEQEARLYLSVVTIGELRRGVERIRDRGDLLHADLLEAWLQRVLDHYADYILDFTATESQVWGCLRLSHPHSIVDAQIAATALTYDLILVTGNLQSFANSGVRLLNPFQNRP